MLELILMTVFCQKLREILQPKDRFVLGYQAALVMMWFIVEPIWLVILCAAMFFRLGAGAEPLVLFAYAAALLATFATALLILLIAHALPPASGRSLSGASLSRA